MSWKGWEQYVPPGAAVPVKLKRSKYSNQPQWVLADLQVVRAIDGPLPAGAIWFMSKREAERYVALQRELCAGTITGLVLQPQYSLGVTTPGGVRIGIGRYIADFSYWRVGSAIQVIEDSKGMRTELYQWKKKHVEAEYGIRIVEV